VFLGVTSVVDVIDLLFLLLACVMMMHGDENLPFESSDQIVLADRRKIQKRRFKISTPPPAIASAAFGSKNGNKSPCNNTLSFKIFTLFIQKKKRELNFSADKQS
jgi:hypothetical protein